MNKKKLLIGVGAAICAVAVTALIIVYTFFTSSHIFTESADHLQEIYAQVNSSYSAVINRNWNVLHGWSKYIEEKAATDEDALAEFIEARRADWSFTNFYFLNDEGVGRLVKAEKNEETGEEIKQRDLNISQEKLEALKQNQNVVVSGMRGDDNVAITLFAIPADVGGAGVYQGFEYNALGITFDSADMTETLNIEAFSGEGRCYITDSIGEILMTSEKEGEDDDYFTNFLAHLRDHNAVFTRGSYKVIEDGLKNGKSDIHLITIHGVEYYMTYRPVRSDDGTQFNDWMMLGIVPSEVLNASMGTFRTVTIIIMAGIFILLGVAVVIVVIFINRRHVHAKELELKSRDGLFDLLTMNTNEIFVLFSPDDFKSQYISPNLERVLGIKPELVASDVRNIMNASADSHKAFTSEGLKQLSKQDTWDADVRMHNVVTQDEYWFKLTLYRTNFNGGDNFVMMFSDRTKERNMNTKLEDALGLAKAANNAKSNFLSNMSHDIRTPMNAIIGFATLLGKDADKPDKVREYVRKITFSSQHLLSLINDVLDMSKIESGRTSLNISDFTLSEFLEEFYSIIVAQSKAKAQTLEIHTKGVLPETVLGDKLRLNQILINLVSNAVKYTPKGGEIIIAVEALPHSGHNRCKLRFIVKDNGIGMSEDFVKTVFEPFTRESRAATKEIQGTGLGMAITKNIVDLMGGTITVESELGVGSTFAVELEFAVAEKSEEEADFWTRHCVTRALVVDDEEEVCLDVKELMDGTGVEISYALDGYRAVEMINEACDKNEDYNIVLLDWKMPGLNGIEAAKLIREKVGNDVPILILTSYDFEEIEEEAKAAGIDYFLPKPFFVSNFRRAVSQIKETDKLAVSAEKEEVSLQGLNLLVAEDNEINVEILVDLLDIEGVVCDVAPNGQEAVEKFEAAAPGTYDLVLMDIQMPVMNGYEAARAIRASKHADAKTIPILAMTANAFADDVKQALDSGMNAHLAKPIDIEKVKATIASLSKKK